MAKKLKERLRTLDTIKRLGTQMGRCSKERGRDLIGHGTKSYLHCYPIVLYKKYDPQLNLGHYKKIFISHGDAKNVICYPMMRLTLIQYCNNYEGRDFEGLNRY